MKYIFSFLLIFSLITKTHSQVREAGRELLVSNKRIEISPVFLTIPPFAEPPRIPGETMRNVGRGLTLGGILLLGVGIGILSSDTGTTSTTYNSSTGNLSVSNQPSLDEQLGSVFTVNGLGMVITGIILWTKGTHKMRAAEIERLGFDLKGNNAVVRYRF